MSIRTESFVIEAGLLVRRHVISAVTSIAREHGLDCKHERAGRSIRFTVSGPPHGVSTLLAAVAATFG